MEVAIMGAGISGLTCAITLEKNGITPTIFEKRSSVGDRFVNAEAMFSILNRPARDWIPYISENYDINLEPIDDVDKLFIHSKNEIGTINGKIGYTNVRGRHENSYESQLENQVKSKINFNSTYEYAELCKNFEHVVLATGDGDYASHLGNYNCNLTCTIKGATVQGNFVTSNPHVWFNYEILPKGYGWLIPFSEKEANLVIAYPDYPDNIRLDLNDIWEKFNNLACKSLDQNLKITDNFEVTRYMLGICNKAKIDNTYFVGNCFGAISPGLGFGQYISILTGVYSAFGICGLESYDKLAKPLFENYNHSLVFRRFMESLTDEQMDFQIKNLDNKIIDNLVDIACNRNSSVDLLKLSTPMMRLWNNYKEFKK
ncbi:NAD(P)/FAD-dependent oxidoreductase [Clostridium estertheticum]|uniref:NAD(P)/FAD-dependent oxidoreductase n=1 Tax=Clostridium estertheticum TaxID=238834 RepID=A0A5N7IV71_9CLOT|nr:NAD(P)/FAD-dependent oxidoreductase [Clostridium estertheticum]MPQ34189.1 NAD(P)/FAD-dependent oxidoreductase [Clostridium estertheticum]MPQ64612.1 NAD(P)/FAD-dependent oxidoreductase [Clostridium estertheticum]